MINLIPATADESYRQKVIRMNPLAYWPLDDVGTDVADNAMGDANYDGARASGKTAQLRPFYGEIGENFFATRINIYSAALNTNLNRSAEGSICFWFRVIDKQTWTYTDVMRILNLRIDDDNRIIVQITTTGVLQVIRIANGNTQTLSKDFSASKPLDWNCVCATITVNEMKLFVNDIQEGATLTETRRMSSGALSSTSCVIGAQDTSNILPLRNVWLCNVALFNRGLRREDVTKFSQRPAFIETVGIDHHVIATWNIFSILGITGGSLACFAEDVDGDGELEFVGNVGRRARFAAIKMNGTVLWDTTVDATQAESLRFAQLQGGVLYYGWLNRAVAININTGAVIWNKTPMASPPASGLGGLNYCSLGVVMASGNKLDILDYATGNSIGGNYPVTLPFDQWEQSLAVGIFGTSTEVIICNDNANNMICFNVNGTIRFQKGPLVAGSWVNENDWYEFFDIQNTGNKVLALVGDDDDTSTQPAEEGDEMHIYSDTGTQLDKYDDGIHTGGLQFHCYAWPNGGRVAFTHESDYTNRRLTMLDHNLEEVWAVDVGNPYEGDQCSLVDIDGDGHPEILFSVQVYDADTTGFRAVRWQDGLPVRFFSDDSPLQFDDLVDDKGAAVNIRVSHEPYVWPSAKFIQFTLRTTDNTGHEKIYLHEFTTDGTRRLIFEGNSLFNRYPSPYIQPDGYYIPKRVYALTGARDDQYTFVNFSLSGQTQTLINQELPRRIKRIQAGDVVVIWEGTNDLFANSLTGAQGFANLLTYIQAVKAVGATVVVCTIIARDAAGDPAGLMDTEIPAYNSLVNSNAVSVGYTVCDLAADARFNARADASSADYDADKFNLALAGQNYIATLLTTHLAGIL